MKVLHLTLKKKWFDMIASGEKTEEYREVKEYWRNRLCNYDIVSRNNSTSYRDYYGYKYFDAVCFKNGDQKDAPMITVECKGIEIGVTVPEWSDNWQGNVFVIKLGKIITISK